MCLLHPLHFLLGKGAFAEALSPEEIALLQKIVGQLFCGCFQLAVVPLSQYMLSCREDFCAILRKVSARKPFLLQTTSNLVTTTQVGASSSCNRGRHGQVKCSNSTKQREQNKISPPGAPVTHSFSSHTTEGKNISFEYPHLDPRQKERTGWALQGHSALDTLGLGTPHSRDEPKVGNNIRTALTRT